MVSDLLRDGVLRFAAQPPLNWQHLDFPRYTLPLIEHDYPARTAAMWNTAYRRFAMDAGNVMLVGDAGQSGVIFDALRRDPRYLGGGAGVGFKEAALPYLDDLEPLSREAGSVNFITKEPDNRLRGHNTDGIGYADSLEQVFAERGWNLRGRTVLMLGAGGTASAVAFALAERGATLAIVNRTTERAVSLASRVNALFGEGCARGAHESETERIAAEADVVVNVSTKGSAGPLAEYSALGPAELPLTEESLQRNLGIAARIMARLRSEAIISDVVIAKGGTPFLRQAEMHGFRVLDGVPMVIGQAIVAFWILHGAELAGRRVSKEEVAQVMRASGS